MSDAVKMVGSFCTENESEASKNISHQNLLGPALNVTVRAGENALLACLAPHLGEKTVKSFGFNRK